VDQAQPVCGRTIAGVSTVVAADKRRAAPFVAAGLVAAGCAYVGLTDPSGGGAFVPCPLHAATGLWCPGCGMTRGLHHLLNGDVPAALSSNLLLPVVVVIAVWGWLAWWRPTFPRLGSTLPGWVWPALAAVAAAFGVARNLPVDLLQTLAP
jgi:hypothetical protein